MSSLFGEGSQQPDLPDITPITTSDLFNLAVEANALMIDSAVLLLTMNKSKKEVFEELIVRGLQILQTNIVGSNFINVMGGYTLMAVNEAERRILSGEVK